MLRVGAYTGGSKMPGGRFRVAAYVPHMEAFDIAITEFPSWVGTYPPRATWRRPAWFGARLAESFAGIVRSRRHDLVLFQRELLATLVTAEPLYGRPRVLDVDYAIWLHPRGAFALRLARHCDALICGNDYLADYFSEARRPTFVLPTGVDTERFIPNAPVATGPPTIGWSGSSSNLRYLETLDPVFAVLTERYPEMRIRVVCDRAPNFKRVPARSVEFLPWSPSIEVSALQDLNVGLMPLEDSAWARGKCAFKMLTYMACGVPVVVSPVGVNAEILRQGKVGFGARTDAEWVESIEALLNDRDMGMRMGRAGRSLVESSYSISALAPRFAALLTQIAGGP